MGTLDKHKPAGAAKISKTKAAYAPEGGTPQRRCGNCSMFVRSVYGCTLVEGHIRPGATCKFWERE